MLLGFIDFLNSREKAIVLWLGVVGIYAFRSPDVRSSFGAVLRTLASWKLMVVFGSAAVYSALVVLASHELDLWHWSSITETLYWFFGTAVVLVGNSMSATTDSSHFRKLLRQAIRLTILVEFLVAFYVFPLLAELVLIPGATFLVAMNILAESNPEFAQVRKVINSIATFLGLVLLTVAVIRAFDDLGGLFNRLTAEQLLVAPALTLSLTPLLYMWGLISEYEQLFFRVNFFGDKDRPFPPGVRWAIFRVCRLNLARLTRFSKQFTGRLHGLETQGDRDEMIMEFQENERRRIGRKSR